MKHHKPMCIIVWMLFMCLVRIALMFIHHKTINRSTTKKHFYLYILYLPLTTMYAIPSDELLPCHTRNPVLHMWPTAVYLSLCCVCELHWQWNLEDEVHTALKFKLGRGSGYSCKVWEWINDFIPHFIGYVCFYPSWYQSQSMLVKEARGDMTYCVHVHVYLFTGL